LIAEIGQPLMSTSLILPGDPEPLTDIYDIQDRMEHLVDLIIDSGSGGNEATTVIDLAEGAAQVLRTGKGDPTPFQ